MWVFHAVRARSDGNAALARKYVRRAAGKPAIHADRSKDRRSNSHVADEAAVYHRRFSADFWCMLFRVISSERSIFFLALIVSEAFALTLNTYHDRYFAAAEKLT